MSGCRANEMARYFGVNSWALGRGSQSAHPMDGTFGARHGLRRITGRLPMADLRLLGLCLTAVVGAALITWISWSTWVRVDALRREFGGLKADSFYLGVRMRAEIQGLNDTLLRYRLRGEAADADAFRSDAEAFNTWLAQNRTNAVTPAERQLFDEVGAAYTNYLADSAGVLATGAGQLPSAPARDFKKSYESVQSQSGNLVGLCDTFIANQRLGFAGFLAQSQHTVLRLQRLLLVSLALLLVVAVVLVIEVYRGMIAPLQHQLSKSRAAIARQEKLASLGVLAAGVAHEIRNPLTAIKVRLFSLRKNLPSGGSQNEDAAVIGNEITRLERIVRDFLDFARPSEPEFVVVPAQRILEEVRALLKPIMDKAGVELTLKPAASAWIRADVQQLKQVLINLIQNSADSAGRNGRITLRVLSEPARGRNVSPGNVVVEVADNGTGIPPEVQRRLFDPFFTTKEGGTGLGLPIAARIVEKHGGHLGYRTRMNIGTTFSIVLPGVREHEA
jgi:signal transduction histidine kinase